MDVPCLPVPAGGRTRQRGFTLANVLVTIAIGAVLLTQAIPSLQAFIQRNRVSTAVNRFSGALQYARSEAVRRSRRVVLCPSADGRGCADTERWAQGWIVFADLDGDRERDRNEPLLRTAPGFPAGISMRSSRHRRRIRYQALGNTHGTNASFTFCDGHGRARPRVICLSGTGRPRVTDRRCDGKPVRCPAT